MSVFNQQGQKVKYQYNAGRDINLGDVQNKTDLVAELKKLEEEIKKAVQSNVLNEEVAIDVESNLKKATIQAQKVNPDKKVLLDYVEQAKKLIENISSMGSVLTALNEVAKVIGGLF